MKAVIWGAGGYLELVLKYIGSDVMIQYVVDSDKKKQGMSISKGIKVISPEELRKVSFDLIIVSVQDDKAIEQDIERLGYGAKTVYFWRDYANENRNAAIFKNRIRELQNEIQKNRIYQARLDSAPYEWGIKKIKVPEIKSAELLLQKMLQDGSSLCRYGDSDFEIILGRDRAWYQKKNDNLAKHLKEILRVNNPDINIAIAQNFRGLERYTEKAADGIRLYLEGNVRHEVASLLSDEVTYYDAYVSRPYCIYKDSKNADVIFPLFKKLWKNRDVCIIEGVFGRFGIGNDLLSHVGSVSRIACPARNAWDKYGLIKSYIMNNIQKDRLLLISLGSTATVLAYELALEGYQAVDIGQLDNEYDWYLAKTPDRIAIKGKMVAEVSQKWEKEPAIEKVYNQQLIAKII